ncbi:hypothetical protein ACI3L1_09340 [Deinococcus sp. SM5_A1]
MSVSRCVVVQVSQQLRPGGLYSRKGQQGVRLPAAELVQQHTGVFFGLLD